jgi:hypothetical protein
MAGYSKRSAVSEVSVKERIFCFSRVVIKKYVSISAGTTSVLLTHRRGSGRPLNAKAQVQFEATSCGICVNNAAIRQVFSAYNGLPTNASY